MGGYIKERRREVGSPDPQPPLEQGQEGKWSSGEKEVGLQSSKREESLFFVNLSMA